MALFSAASSKFKLIINEELPFCLLSGTVVLKPNVKEFTESSAVFEDGTTEGNIDVVLFATGYNFSFPFLEESVGGSIHDNRSLYNCIFPPQLEQPTLAIIGLIQLTGSIMVGSEMQARWVTGVFAGRRWGRSSGWEVWGSQSCCPHSLGHISAPWVASVHQLHLTPQGKRWDLGKGLNVLLRCCWSYYILMNIV